MAPETEKKLLQGATALACLVPLSMGLQSVVESASVLRGVREPIPIDLDSHFRYLSGLLLGAGLVFLACLPRIERRRPVFLALGAIILVGGLSRLLSLVQNGWPSDGHRFGLVMELAVVPAIVLWQSRVARRFEARAQKS
ncbi:MAG TPA: DUF4345 domain-containing protein [Allosphingosinicella sp.]|jgi:hypothetical protein|uniref:DUF4345 domain-containing protein n=1 Tax=Allosphingosinicella sp. TaxID=2823234 RepID=UPI002F2AF6EF